MAEPKDKKRPAPKKGEDDKKKKPVPSKKDGDKKPAAKDEKGKPSFLNKKGEKKPDDKEKKPEGKKVDEPEQGDEQEQQEETPPPFGNNSDKKPEGGEWEEKIPSESEEIQLAIGTAEPDEILINPNIKTDVREQVITDTCQRDDAEQISLQEKADAAGIPLEVLETVYERGIVAWFEHADLTHTAQQFAFSRVASFISGGKAWSEDSDLQEAAKAERPIWSRNLSKIIKKQQDMPRVDKTQKRYWKVRARPGQKVFEMVTKVSPTGGIVSFKDFDARTNLHRALKTMKTIGVGRGERARLVATFKNHLRHIKEGVDGQLNEKLLGVLSAMSAQNLRPEHLTVKKDRVRTRVGNMSGKVVKVYEHPIKGGHFVHFIAGNGQKYRTSMDNVVKEEADVGPARGSKEWHAARAKFHADKIAAHVVKAKKFSQGSAAWSKQMDRAESERSASIWHRQHVKEEALDEGHGYKVGDPVTYTSNYTKIKSHAHVIEVPARPMFVRIRMKNDAVSFSTHVNNLERGHSTLVKEELTGGQKKRLLTMHKRVGAKPVASTTQITGKNLDALKAGMAHVLAKGGLSDHEKQTIADFKKKYNLDENTTRSKKKIRRWLRQDFGKTATGPGKSVVPNQKKFITRTNIVPSPLNSKYTRLKRHFAIKEEAPGADAERKRLLTLHASIKHGKTKLTVNDRGLLRRYTNRAIVEAKSYFSVRDKKGVVRYMGGDYVQANKLRKSVAGAHIHRHHKVDEATHPKHHGSPYDRGDADAYYQRPKKPHHYKGGGLIGGKRVSEKDMASHEIEAYHAGYDENPSGKKDYS